jgi:transmembrane sensor
MRPLREDIDQEPATLEEEAARWRVRLSASDASARELAAFEGWLKESSEHRSLYESMDRAWGLAGGSSDAPEILELREAALSFRPSSRGRPIMFGAGVAAALLLSFGVWLGINRAKGPDSSSAPLAVVEPGATTINNARQGEFQTQVGERSTLRLVDGSVLTLDTASKVALDLFGQIREVHLLQGRANFEVARDPSRPFVVYAADRRITAIGTDFDVRLNEREIQVTLVEGKVAVDQLARGSNRAKPDTPMVRTKLQAGEQLNAPVGGAASVRGADLERSTSWRDGRLVFAADRLADAVAEMNRYSRAPIVLGDAAVGELKVSGVFRTADPQAFARALTEYFNVETSEQGNATVLRWRRSQ